MNRTKPLPDVVPSLRRIVGKICSDALFRRSLRYRPGEAFQALGLDPKVVPTTLPVRHYGISVEISELALFGSSEPGAHAAAIEASDPPFEIRLVRYGLKPMALVHGENRQMSALLRRCHQWGLYAMLSPHEFQPQPDALSGGYVNIANRQAVSSVPTAWRGLLVGLDSQSVVLGWLSLLFDWDLMLGTLLGYPACCVRSYPAHWREACGTDGGEVATVLVRHAVDRAPAQASSRVVSALHPTMNLFARFFGFQLTQHFPCSFSCAPTARLGEVFSRTLIEFEPAMGVPLRDVLAAPVLHTRRQGSFLFRGGVVESGGAGVRYEPSRLLSSLPGSPLAAQLREAGRCELAPEGLSVGPADGGDDGWLIRFDRGALAA